MQNIYRRLNRPKFKLSILICSLPNRLDTLYDLVLDLENQSRNKNVQILYLGDNKSLTVGEKRNLLLDASSGEYITFIDDDHVVSADYIDSVLEGLKTEKNVITFEVRITNEEKEDVPYIFGKTERGHRVQHKGKQYKKVMPNHLCVWKKEIIKERFPHINLSEDWKWAKLMLEHYTDADIHNIDKVLYHYKFNPFTSETRRK